MLEKLINVALKFYPKFLWDKKESVVIKKIRLPLLNKQHDHPLTLIHISDLHIGFNYSYEDLIYHINMINQYHADIVVITGDLFDHINQYRGDAGQFSALLKTIHAKLGVYFIYGNHDQREFQTHKIAEIVKNADITLLVNEGCEVNYDGETLYICGLDDVLNGNSNPIQALKNKSGDMPTIALIHEPDYADFAKRFNIDLQLSGHSHGGQIKLPLLPPPIRPSLGKRYIRGLFKLRYKDHSMYLHVSPGLGTTRLPIRLFCRSEITIFELTKR